MHFITSPWDNLSRTARVLCPHGTSHALFHPCKCACCVQALGLGRPGEVHNARPRPTPASTPRTQPRVLAPRRKSASPRSTWAQTSCRTKTKRRSGRWRSPRFPPAARASPGWAPIPRSRAVDAADTIEQRASATGHDSFDWGCSHSGYERIVWDPAAQHFITVCKNDAPTGGKSGEARVRTEQLAAWDSARAPGDLNPSSAGRQLYVQALDAADGSSVSPPISVAVRNNRYQEMKPFPDGSVAYVAPGRVASKLEILRVLPCE